MTVSSSLDLRILVVAPIGVDAVNTAQVLRKGGFDAEIFSTVSEAAEEIPRGCGFLLVTEEALQPGHAAILAEALARQPKWSSIPVVLITSAGKENGLQNRWLKPGLRSHLTLLERPMRAATLLATSKAALATREQQYDIRDLIEEREKLLNSLEDRVNERTAKLQALVAEMEAFSYSVSHDLRAPLRVLDGYAQALREDYTEHLPAPAHRLLDKISHAARRMDLLTQDLLAYTRVANSEITLGPIDLDEIFADVIESYPGLRESREKIHLAVPLGLVLGHGPSLLQCFSNLLENAVKFTKPNSAPHIEVRSEKKAGRVRIFVSDRGIGIPAGEQERIFGLFERAGNPSTPGTGIGLAIVKKAAERMRGSVGLESIVGRGSTFWIELEGAERK